MSVDLDGEPPACAKCGQYYRLDDREPAEHGLCWPCASETVTELQAELAERTKERDGLHREANRLALANRELETGLAKAWEAGREEAAKLMDKRKGRWTTAYSETPDAAAIRALQPPGKGTLEKCSVDLVWMRPGNRPGGIIPCNRPAGHEGAHQALTNETPGGKAK